MSSAWPLTAATLALGVLAIVFRKPYARFLGHTVQSMPTAPFGLKDKKPASWRRYTVVGAIGMMVVGMLFLLVVP